MNGPQDRRARLDPAMLRRVRDRDPVAMNVFFASFFDRVHGYVTRLLKDATLAEDLTQDAFLRMHAAIDRLDPERDPSPWVFTVVTNTVKDHWRSKQHRNSGQSVSLDEAWEVPSETDRSAPDRGIEQKQDAARVRDAMALLSPADREILLLRCFQSLTTSEVQEALGISSDAVRQRYSRAVRRLGVIYRERVSLENRVSA